MKTGKNKKRKSNKKRKPVRNVKKTYLLIALGIFSTCAFLLIASFLLVPNIASTLDKQHRIQTTSEQKTETQRANTPIENKTQIANKPAKDNATRVTAAPTKPDKASGNSPAKQKTTPIDTPTKPHTASNGTRRETEMPQTQHTSKPAQNPIETPLPHQKVNSPEKTSSDTKSKIEAPSDTKSPSKTTPKQSGTIAKVESASEKSIIKPAKAGVLVFVFDDAGHNLVQLQKFLNLPFKCSIAVLPGLPYSKEAADKIRAAGHDVMLHQPMQALNRNLDPGPNAITAAMTPDEVRPLLRENIAALEPLVGMNNHEGSLITGDETLTRAFLQTVKEKNILFLDSRTNANTVVPKIAAELNMPILERNIFLDNSKKTDDMKRQVEIGMEYARKHGQAILIGHIFTPELADLLREMYPSIIAQGFEIKRISELSVKKEVAP